jgi:hypothetical protein
MLEDLGLEIRVVRRVEDEVVVVGVLSQFVIALLLDDLHPLHVVLLVDRLQVPMAVLLQERRHEEPHVVLLDGPLVLIIPQLLAHHLVLEGAHRHLLLKLVFGLRVFYHALLFEGVGERVAGLLAIDFALILLGAQSELGRLIEVLFDIGEGRLVLGLLGDDDVLGEVQRFTHFRPHALVLWSSHGVVGVARLVVASSLDVSGEVHGVACVAVGFVQGVVVHELYQLTIHPTDHPFLNAFLPHGSRVYKGSILRNFRVFEGSIDRAIPNTDLSLF